MLGQARFRPVNAIRTDPLGEFRIGGNQQEKPACAANHGKPARYARAIACAEMAINKCRPARQTSRHGARIRRTLWVGEKKQCRNTRRTGLAVEPARDPR